MPQKTEKHHKRGTIEKKYKDYSTNKLKQEISSLYQSIYVTECFGLKDLVGCELIAHELEKRGIEVTIEQALVFHTKGHRFRKESDKPRSKSSKETK